MERWYMLESAYDLAAIREKRVEEVEYEEVFGHDATDAPGTYAGILQRLIEEAGGFEKLTAQQLTLIEEQARELASRKRKKATQDG